MKTASSLVDTLILAFLVGALLYLNHSFGVDMVIVFSCAIGLWLLTDIRSKVNIIANESGKGKKAD